MRGPRPRSRFSGSDRRSSGLTLELDDMSAVVTIQECEAFTSPPRADEFGGEPSRAIPGGSVEIPVHQSLRSSGRRRAEVTLPVSVHGHFACQGMGRIDQPASRSEPVGRSVAPARAESTKIPLAGHVVPVYRITPGHTKVGRGDALRITIVVGKLSMSRERSFCSEPEAMPGVADAFRRTARRKYIATRRLRECGLWLFAAIVPTDSNTFRMPTSSDVRTSL